MKQTVVPSGTGKGSSDIVRVIYCILLFPVLLFSFYVCSCYCYILGRKKGIQWFIVALMNVLVEALYWRRPTADECKT